MKTSSSRVKRRLHKRIVGLRYHASRLILVMVAVLLVAGTSAYALDNSASKTKSADAAKSAQTAKTVTPTPNLPVADPVPPPVQAPPATTPAVKPKPKPAANPAASPAAVSATNTSPGNGASGLTPTGGSPPPATPPDNSSPSTPCVGTPASYASLNWAGYLKTGCTFTAVSGAWTVPTPTSTSTTDISADAAWIGIGGATSNDLIQVGTTDIVDTDGTINSAVFYELLPAFPHYPTSITVVPGDHISASITETTTNTWLISITNSTRSQTYTKTVNYTSTHSSAEWIEEDPSYADDTLVPFNDFGTVFFTDTSATGNGTAGTLADASSVTLVSTHGHVFAQPSAVSGANHDAFNVVRKP